VTALGEAASSLAQLLQAPQNSESAPAEPLLLCAAPASLAQYEAQERAFAAALGAYVRAQFGSGAALLEAATSTADTASANGDTADGDIEGLRGPSAEKYAQHRRELSRLREAERTAFYMTATANASVAGNEAALAAARRAAAAPPPAELQCVHLLYPHRQQ
jgi:hypothetical protein